MNPVSLKKIDDDADRYDAYCDVLWDKYPSFDIVRHGLQDRYDCIRAETLDFILSTINSRKWERYVSLLPRSDESFLVRCRLRLFGALRLKYEDHLGQFGHPVNEIELIYHYCSLYIATQDRKFVALMDGLARDTARADSLVQALKQEYAA